MPITMNCPFCHKPLVEDPDGYYTCYTDNCPVMDAGGNGASGTVSLWLKVIQMHNALKEIVANPHGAACHNYARAKEALKEIYE